MVAWLSETMEQARKNEEGEQSLLNGPCTLILHTPQGTQTIKGKLTCQGISSE